MTKPLVPFRFENLDDYFKDKVNNPNEFLYGAHNLIERGEVDTLFCPRGKRDTVLRWASFLFQQLFTRTAKLGLPIEMVLENKRKINSSSKVICINDPISLAFLFGKKLGLVRVPVVAMFQSITERRRKYFSTNFLLLSFYRWVLSEADSILTLSNASKEELTEYFGVNRDKIKVFQFGADKEYWEFKPWTNERLDSFILSVGNDGNRDYNVLVNALAEKHKIKIVTRLKVDEHDNVEILNNISNNDLKALYQSCMAVVTPSVDLKTESSGLSTTVQAMSCGAPVILSSSPALAETFEDGKEIIYFKACSEQSLKEVFDKDDNGKRFQNISQQARKTIDEKVNSESMESLFRDVLKQ